MAAPGNGPPPIMALNRSYSSHISSQAHTTETFHDFIRSIQYDVRHNGNTSINKKKLTVINNLLGLTLEQFINTTGINIISRETIYAYINQTARGMPNINNMNVSNMNVSGGRRKRTRRAKRSRRTRRHRKH